MTELIWEGKYKDGNKVAPVRIALPFQTIETMNESSQQRQKTLDFFAGEPSNAYGKEWRNRLIRCNTARELTKEKWNYLKVLQKEFEGLHPENFEELLAGVNPQILLN